MKLIKCVFANSLNKILILTLCLFIAFNVSSCDSHEDNCTCEGIETEIRDDYVKIILTDFVGEHEFEIPRSVGNDGSLFGTASIVYGNLRVYHDMGKVDYKTLVFSLNGEEEDAFEGSYVDGTKVTIMIEASIPTSGVIELGCKPSIN